jgi:hypothetical protein
MDLIETPTIGLFRYLNGGLDTLFRINLSHSPKSNAPSSRERCPTSDKLLVAQPDLYAVSLTSLETVEDPADICGAKTKEGIPLRRVDTELYHQFVVNEKVATAGDVEPNLPVTILVWGKRCGVLKRNLFSSLSSRR